MKGKITYNQWDTHAEEILNNQFKDFMDVIKWAYQVYKNDILYACSLGAEGIVLIDLIYKVNPRAKVVFLDTDLHFKETYVLINKVKERYPKLHIKIVKPTLNLDEQATQYGEELWEIDPNMCCTIRKIKPLQKELTSVDAWISGLRREQSSSRKNIDYINKDTKFKRVKICPLIHWTWDDVWNYIHLNNLPYNELHDHNYPSIGCEKCTLPVNKKSDSRSGRWANSEKKECGLHQA
ncbi:phosphoadenylyl-sulfate reductase [Aquibacillus rhizosphaerae]|uniref:Adenosine 5'-phosphosulfate reductase n=1 Tax=Aquibacillus rhizosphaerae TaxID=3051431 RepID=A0ABT7LAX8_9BACI|nr:phosphoadenylyl-sulfate reductase [Aquibacillus sp. LR5S19]MDL4843011.1 phosphoadenylyl-sulfate reductase [Aquibacillus sp. LR5S19]